MKTLFDAVELNNLHLKNLFQMLNFLLLYGAFCHVGRNCRF